MKRAIPPKLQQKICQQSEVVQTWKAQLKTQKEELKNTKKGYDIALNELLLLTEEARTGQKPLEFKDEGDKAA